MCGISGIFSFNEHHVIDEQLLKNMNNAQAHRGPNDQGYHIGKGIGLGHRRLSIIDLAGGHQPIYNEDDTVSVVFNGEIFNHHEVEKELKDKGHVFKTNSDTETIVHAWEEWGVECVHHFRGMFAFIIWDDNKKELFVVRDRLGIKPLHYSLLTDGSVIFGSELKVLRQHPLCPNEISPEAIEDYLTFGYVPDPKTIFTNTYKLEAGHYLHLKQGKLPVKLISKQYWDLPWQATEQLSAKEIESELIERLKDAVNVRMEAEVPLGSFLSGGVDSGAIVAMMSQLQDKAVTTCSIGFDVPEFNETDFAQLVAEQYKTNHNVETINHEDFDLIDKLIDIYDEPYSDSSALPTYRVCELARKHVTVALSGDGGDELFCGYSRYNLGYSMWSKLSMLPASVRPLVAWLCRVAPGERIDVMQRLLPERYRVSSLADRLPKLAEVLAHSSGDQFYKTLVSHNKHPSGLVLGSCEPKTILDASGDIPDFGDLRDRMMYLDTLSYLPGDILTKVDRASMAVSLEARVPLLDHRLVEYAWSLPLEMKIKNGQGKWPLRQVLYNYVPKEMMERPKQGFGVPIEHWLTGPLKDWAAALLDENRLRQEGYFDPAQITLMWNEHLSGKRRWHYYLWDVLMFQAWLAEQ